MHIYFYSVENHKTAGLVQWKVYWSDGKISGLRSSVNFEPGPCVLCMNKLTIDLSMAAVAIFVRFPVYSY